MRTRFILMFLAAMLIAALSTNACEQKLAHLVTVSVSRCLQRDVTLGFEGHVVADDDRKFITLSDADAKRLYEALKPYYADQK